MGRRSIWSKIRDFFRGRRRRGPPPPPPPIEITIPNYPFPPNIIQYLISQSQGYVISYSSASDFESTLSVNSAPITRPQNSYGNEFTFVNATTRPPVNKNAYMTTLPPTQTTVPVQTNPVNPPPSQPLLPANLPSEVPDFWVAAVRAMEYTAKIGTLKSFEQVEDVFKEISVNLDAYKEVNALIYFCTIISRLFEPFREKFVYNYLNQRFPEIFFDAFSYQRILIIYIYYTKCSNFLNNFNELGYINKSDRVMLYAVAPILKSIKNQLTNVNPVGNTMSVGNMFSF